MKLEYTLHKNKFQVIEDLDLGPAIIDRRKHPKVLIMILKYWLLGDMK